jgi:large conductance mechanosensitive channel
MGVSKGVVTMAGVQRVPRSRGALIGIVLIFCGAWGALTPFIGPHFHYAYTSGDVSVYSPARVWLEITPGAATAAGGLILLGSALRAFAAFGAWLAALAGAWFIIGPTLLRLWASSGFSQLVPVGGALRRSAEQLGFFAGLGVVIVFCAALALGRLATVAGEARPAAGRPGVPPWSQFSEQDLSDMDQEAPASADTVPPRQEAGMLRGFRSFLMQGDLIVIAVGLVVALAFSTLIKTFTDNIITPLVNAAAGGGVAAGGLGWTINGQRINLGAFIGAMIYFVIFVAVVYFLIVVPYRVYMRRRGMTVFGEPQPTRMCPECKAADLPIDATRCRYCASRLTAVAVS